MHAKKLIGLVLAAGMWGFAALLAYGADSAATQPGAISSDVAHPVVIPPADACGGGWADGGPTGAYFANPDLAGEPAFTRHDVRVDFDWGKYLPVGGSTAEPYASFPHSKFSVRWTGRVVPRFSEDYVFTVRSLDNVRLTFKPAGAAAWTEAKFTSDDSGAGTSQPVHLTAGQLCDVVLEYRNTGKSSAISLDWSSPSAPDQVIDPVAAQGLNAASWLEYCWADETKTSRWGNRKVTTDADGNPAVEIQLILGEGKQSVGGTYDLRFHGQATVKVFGAGATFAAGDKTWKGTLPIGAGYDPATDTTRAKVSIGRKDGIWVLDFLSTIPKGAATQPQTGGISDVHVMRPIAPDSDTAEQPDEVVYRPFKNDASPFTCLRWLGIANQRNDGKWSSRTLPDELQFDRGGIFSPDGGGECWEMLVVLANECGKDLYVTLPMMADDSYFQKFAQLIRYGSDGVNPYDHEVEHPKWPPLNPNLRVYLEVGNEIWNWGFGSTQQCNTENMEQVKAKTPDGKIVSYDGKSNWRRWHALRTVHASNAFRQVLGDSAMGTRMRLLLEYQYNNAQDTALNSCDFLDNWYNNGDGDHVPDPHPIRYFIWGGGGATYYGVGNPVGSQTEVQLPDPSFEKATVPDGTESASAEGSGWTCTGDAGIYRNYWDSVQSFTTNPQPPAPQKLTAAGYSFNVDKTLFARQLGCYMQAGESPSEVYLIGPKGVMAHVSVSTLHYKMSETPGWSYGPIPREPVQLDPGVDYYLVAQPTGRSPRPMEHTLVPGPHFTILKTATVADGAGADPAKWKIDSSGDGTMNLGPVALLASSAADTKPTGLFDPNTGGQGGVIRAGGALSTKINFPKPGHYALTLHAAGLPGYPPKLSIMPFTITVNGKSVDPVSQGDDRLSPDQFGIGGFERRVNQITEAWGSGVFEITAPGEAELRIAAIGKGPGWTVFDDITVASVDAIMQSGFGAGQAYGQVAQNNYTKQLDGEASYARSFGLPPVAYEAGWSLGGDFNARPIQSWCKFRDPRATDINNVAENIFTQAGGFMNVWGVYAYWPAYDMANALTYPLMKSVEDISARLPAEADNGTALPAKLLPDDKVSWGYNRRHANDFPQRGDWNSWLVISPDTQTWAASVHATGAGNWELEIDGVPVSRGSGDGVAYVRLVKGQHGLRFRSLGGGPFKLESIEFTAAPANNAGAAKGTQ